MTTKISPTNQFSNIVEANYANFGTYQLSDELTLTLPNNTMVFSHLSCDKFSYSRQNTQDEITKKIICTKSKTSRIELVPVLPIHIPSYKTDFFFLRFAEPLFIAENSTLVTSIPFPIEVGVFLIGQTHTDALDFFSCDPLNSRFALYGTPENGKLCKYVTVSLDDKSVIMQHVHAQLRVEITNELEDAVSVGKIVFPVTDHDLYFDGGKVMMDGLKATIKNRIGLHVIETIQNPITVPGAKRVLRHDEKTDYKFSMELGFD